MIYLGPRWAAAREGVRHIGLPFAPVPDLSNRKGGENPGREKGPGTYCKTDPGPRGSASHRGAPEVRLLKAK